MKTAYTPAKIVEKNLFFSIPIYQRLFEWDRDNIEQFLDDLYRAYQTNPDEDYHIGLLTATSDGNLVDGQQRFTVLMLLGCVLQDEKYDPRWAKFLNPDSPRLKFQARPQAMIYLRNVMNDGNENLDDSCKQVKMKQGLETIRNKMEGFYELAAQPHEEYTFAEYLYDHIGFFISELPAQYTPGNLNKYFERMNSTGKNLEHHEILKVKLLRHLDTDITPLLKLWNKIAEVDTELLRIRKHRNETESEFKTRREDILKNDVYTAVNNEWINGISATSAQDDSNSKSIREIQSTDTPPKKEGATIRNSKSLLSFPMILLLTLYWKIEADNNKAVTDDKKVKIESLTDFFNPANLLKTFEKYLPYEGAKVKTDEISDFMSRLLKARVVLDYCFVRTAEFGYSLEMGSEDSEYSKDLLRLESMLFVSSNRYTYYKWFCVLMNFVKTAFPSDKELYDELKAHDDRTNPLPEYDKLTYGADIRYWFWRLDFQIWKDRQELFKENPKALAIVEKYRFIRNRSIEHVAPQHPMQNSTLQWDDTAEDAKLRNSFGNLVMISNGLNSALKNKTYEIKKEHVAAYINDPRSGSIESLSLLLINSLYDTWDKKTIEEYGEKTYQLLKKSYS